MNVICIYYFFTRSTTILGKDVKIRFISTDKMEFGAQLARRSSSQIGCLDSFLRLLLTIFLTFSCFVRISLEHISASLKLSLSSPSTLFFFDKKEKKDVGLSRSDTDDLSRCKREKETSGGRCIMVDQSECQLDPSLYERKRKRTIGVLTRFTFGRPAQCRTGVHPPPPSALDGRSKIAMGGKKKDKHLSSSSPPLHIPQRFKMLISLSTQREPSRTF